LLCAGALCSYCFMQQLPGQGCSRLDTHSSELLRCIESIGSTDRLVLAIRGQAGVVGVSERSCWHMDLTINPTKHYREIS
jgi:hypothetical protein